jgi:hypothetical protein
MTGRRREMPGTYFELRYGIRKECFMFDDKGEVTCTFARIYRQVTEAFHFANPKRVDGQPQYRWWRR